LEASALPGTHQASPQPTTQEIPLEPEQDSPPIQETRIEVSVNICTVISSQSSLIQKTFLFRTKLHHHQALYLL
jgi:hypothetical protein